MLDKGNVAGEFPNSVGERVPPFFAPQLAELARDDFAQCGDPVAIGGDVRKRSVGHVRDQS
jgi:hypothetical protein